MGRRMNWSKTKRRDTRTAPADRLERKADRIIAYADRERPVIVTESKSYRCVGTVQYVVGSGIYHALNGDGQVMGTFKTRTEAWQLADKFGMVPC